VTAVTPSAVARTLSGRPMTSRTKENGGEPSSKGHELLEGGGEDRRVVHTDEPAGRVRACLELPELGHRDAQRLLSKYVAARLKADRRQLNVRLGWS
jgi:hypothetical protein